MSSENDTSNTSADAGNSHFTAAEVKFVLAALQHAEGGTLKFDYDAVAAQLGLKNGKTARARWNTIARTKINNAASAGGVSKAGPSKKKAAPKKAAGEDAEKPVREKRGRKAKKEADVKVEEKTEEEEEEEAEEELV